MSRIVTATLLYSRHKPIDHINRLGRFGSLRTGNVLPVRYEHYAHCVLSKRYDGGECPES
jgi:hypothetical protein